MKNPYDTIIIGAGIMGVSSAYQLARRGLAVAVLEKGVLGGVSTGRSSAIIRQHYSNELTARMALYSLDVFRNFDDLIGGDCGFRRTGFLAMVAAKDQAGLEANVALQQNIGINTSIVSTDVLRELLPELECADLVAAAYEPDSGYADPQLSVGGYVDGARRIGVEFFPDTEVCDITWQGERVNGVRTNRGAFSAPVVINCAGPWGARVARMAGVLVPVDACRVQVAVFERPRGREADHPVVLDFVHATYFRSETGSLTLVGRIDPAEAEEVVDPDDYAEHVDADFISYVGERWARRWPVMEMSRAKGGFAGLYAVTPDWHPVMDEVPPGSGFFICTGFSGHGFKLGPAVSVMMADMVTGEEHPRFAAELFRADRFAKRDLVTGRYKYSITG